MPRDVLLTTDEHDALERLGRRVRLARLRRNLTQEDLAERAGTTRKTVRALEQGRETVSVGLLLKVMTILGYPDRLPALLESDPIGEDLEEVHGRKRAGGVSGVADF
ncbi:helix-turn-helix domain-containing protein [Azospirillum sp. SYSU D00513]|uniref:helix-turn-helix transcriptional regulator n=1 Tax=Azospirillum sp. SYSU D00513 TaxID=2812561 RepID=UPI001A96DCDA|nr:helix-turn-helix domain-containing protein [Azospirillum sp. SYSU D00513]